MSTQPRAVKAKLPIWAKLSLALVLVVTLVALIVVVLGVAATNRWQRYAADLRAKGEPLTFAEIEAKRTPIPDEQNGMRVFEAFGPRLDEVKVTREDGYVLVLGSQSLSDELFDGFPRAAIEPSQTFVDRYRELLASLSRLREMPVGRIDVRTDEAQTDPWHYLLPEVPHLRKASKLVYLDALMTIATGDTEGALADAETLAAIAGTLNEDPFIIGRLVQIATEAQLSKLIEITLRTGAASPETIGRIQKVVQTRLASATMKWAFLGERAFFVAFCDALASGHMSPDSLFSTSGTQLPRWIPVWLIRANQTTGTELLSTLVEAGDDPIAISDAAHRMETEVQRMGVTKVLVKMMLPSLGRSATLHQKIIGTLRSTRAALAAERFRLDHDRMPSSLEELLPAYLDAVPADPFDGQPLRFATTDRGIVIYSIGENLVDDGGDLKRHRKRPHGPPDTGFRLLKPDHRGLILIDESTGNDAGP